MGHFGIHCMWDNLILTSLRTLFHSLQSLYLVDMEKQTNCFTNCVGCDGFRNSKPSGFSLECVKRTKLRVCPFEIQEFNPYIVKYIYICLCIYICTMHVYICIIYVYMYTCVYMMHISYIYTYIVQNPWNEEEAKYWHATQMTQWTLICRRSGWGQLYLAFLDLWVNRVVETRFVSKRRSPWEKTWCSAGKWDSGQSDTGVHALR